MGRQLAGLLQRPSVPEKPPPSDDSASMLTVNQVARALHLHPQTVRGMIKRGEIYALRTGRVWRISRKDVIDLGHLAKNHNFGPA